MPFTIFKGTVICKDLPKSYNRKKCVISTFSESNRPYKLLF